jgi:thymidylate synthase (FAD)
MGWFGKGGKTMKIIQPSIEILTPIDGDYILKFLERCGRTCYKSEDKITEDSAEKFVRALIKSGHESVIEHYSITVKVVCSRAISHQIVRHRIGSYSQESQRYVSYKDGIEVIERPGLKGEALKEWEGAQQRSIDSYRRLIELGIKPEVARDVLANAAATEIVMTLNLRQWRHFCRLRTSPAADPQMRVIAGMILKEFKERLPVIFEDIGGKENAG